MILRAAPDSLYAYVYAQPKQDQCAPYKPGISAFSSNDAWAPYVETRKPQILGSGAFLWALLRPEQGLHLLASFQEGAMAVVRHSPHDQERQLPTD